MEPIAEELLAAIRAAPDDDAPRLVYADWLLERGDGYGDLIIAQCTRSRCERAGDYTSDAYRAAVVTEALRMRDMRKPFLEVLGVEDMANIAFRRGFPVAIGGSPARLVERWPVIGKLPLEMLIFSQGEERVTVGDVRRLAALPPIPTLEILAIASSGATAHLEAPRVLDEIAWIPDDDLDEVFSDDELAPNGPFHDCTLALGHGSSSDGGSVVAFNRSGALPASLRALSICCEHIDEWQLANQMRANGHQLENLQLGQASHQHALSALSDWQHTRLHTLHLDSEDGKFRLEVARRFAISGAARMLRTLEAAFPLDDLVAASLATGRLETLSLTGGGDAAMLEHVLRHNPNIHELTIGGFTGDVVGVLERAAPRELAVLVLRDMKELDLWRLGRWEQRLSSLTVYECGNAESLIDGPALANVPWLHTNSSRNRMPGRAAFRYRGDAWP